MAEAMCYPSAYHYLRKLAKDSDGKSAALLVHGTITLPNGQRIAHAWVEDGDEAVDAKALDQWKHWKKADYYRRFQAQPWKKWPNDAAMSLFGKTLHYGPWVNPQGQLMIKPKKTDWSKFAGLPQRVRVNGALYIRTDRGNLDPFLLKLLQLLERDDRGPQPFDRIVTQYQQTHADTTADEIHARLTELQLAGLVARHARGPGGQSGGRTNYEEYSLTGKGQNFLR
jgi:hypothetical protein